MTHLGAFGEEPEEADDVTFDYFGETFHANADLGELDYVDFLDRAGGMAVDSLEAATVVKQFARMCIAETDFEAFWTLARKKRQSTEQILKVTRAVMEAATDRPTTKPSDSSDGQSSTEPNSGSAPVVSDRLLRRYEGRSDIQLSIVKAAEARAG